jgi:glycosyltransferase 2 family protein
VHCRGRDLAVVVAATGVVAAGAHAARARPPGGVEERVFSTINELDGRAFVPVWTVMQLGSLGGAIVISAAVSAAGRPRLGRRLAVVATLSWTASKAVKPFVGRGRPTAEIPFTRVLGREQLGLGFPSGHTAVAAALAATLTPQIDARLRPAVWLTVLGIGASRLYVGAHLPLDVVGGVALGIGTERVVRRCPNG